jgi:ABC-type xylose transport system permease subunit
MGAVLLAVLRNGLSILAAPVYVQFVFIGAVTIGAVSLDVVSQRAARRGPQTAA